MRGLLAVNAIWRTSCQRLVGTHSSAAVSMDEPLLLALPDDALLSVLAFLPPRQLLTCRVLCRRLRDLCLHPYLWRRVQLVVWDDRCLLRAALRLAPCLRELDLFHLNSELAALAVTEFSHATCVVATLRLLARGAQGVALATAAVQKQSDLGGLQELFLVFADEEEQMEWNLSSLVAAMNRGKHLHSLYISSTSSAPLLASSGDWDDTSSVKKLKFTSTTTEDTFLETLLKAHAATLEHVILNTMHVPVSSLKALPKLRSLTFAMDSTGDLSELKNLPNLASLVFGWCFDVTPGLLELLRGAPQLRCVAVPCTGLDPAAPLRALAASPSACKLEILQVHTLSRSERICGDMAAALPQFPSLGALTMQLWSLEDEGVDFIDFLRTVSPTTAPRLTMLAVPSPVDACQHAWLHDSTAQGLLQRNPRLHLRVPFVSFCVYDCSWCVSGCHSDLKTAFGPALGAHPREAACPPDCYRWP